MSFHILNLDQAHTDTASLIITWRTIVQDQFTSIRCKDPVGSECKLVIFHCKTANFTKWLAGWLKCEGSHPNTPNEKLEPNLMHPCCLRAQKLKQQLGFDCRRHLCPHYSSCIPVRAKVSFIVPATSQNFGVKGQLQRLW